MKELEIAFYIVTALGALAALYGYLKAREDKATLNYNSKRKSYGRRNK